MQIRSKVVRGGVLVVLGLAAGCAGELDLPVGTLVVTVLRDSPPVDASGAKVTIVATSATAITGADGKATLLLPAGAHAIAVALISYCPATTSATVTTGSTTNVTVSLGTTPCVTTGTDKITTGGAEPLYGLVDIRTGGTDPCENDRLVEGTSGTADLLTNALPLTGPSEVCHGAAWVFTAYHAPWFDNTAATFPWTNSSGDVLTTTLPANRLRVPVTFWISDPLIVDATYRAKLTGIGGLLPAADNFLRSMHTGLRLTNSETADTPPDIIHVGTLGSGQLPYSLIGSGCDQTSSITSSAPLVYRPDHINIYVVQAIAGVGSATGRNCVGHGAKNVIFIQEVASDVTLVHEIGHALGLTRPSWGHAEAIKDMIPVNVMESGESGTRHLTLGQIVRAHADTSSWLNQITGIGTVRSRQSTSTPLVTACHCPGDTATADCPTITKDFRTGMPGMGMDDPACHVTADVPCLSLPPLTTGYITARGFTDGTAMKDGFGEGSVGSLAPKIASATLSAEDGNTVTATVIAGSSPGTTQVLMSLGGTFVSVPVHVGTACPP